MRCLVRPQAPHQAVSRVHRFHAGAVPARSAPHGSGSSGSSGTTSGSSAMRRTSGITRAGSPPQQTTTRSAADMTIDDLDTEYCNDFVCTSSPAVEQTVRSLARDITRFKYTRSLFQPDVSYSDGFRRFRGVDKYAAPMWARDTITTPRAVITRMAMLDSGRALIEWTLSGGLAGAGQVSVPMTSTFELNLLTGRVMTHTDDWNLRAVPPPASAALLASRMLWSARAAGRDAGESISKGVSESLSSLTSVDEEEYYGDPTDPTKFFQKQDNTMNDAVMIALAVSGLYLVFKVFETLETM